MHDTKETEIKSRVVDVNNSFIHYREIGEGRPIVFLHGMPVSSYLWRHVMPALASFGRCIAPDLIGMGDSGKPEIQYTIQDHIDYITQFIEVMELKDIIFVLHGWGSVVGFHYAAHHPDQVSGMAFFESHVRAATNWDMLSLPVQQLASLLHNDDASYKAIVGQNYLIKRLLPSGTVRSLDEDALNVYETPFLSEKARQPLWQYVHDLPLGQQAHSPSVDLIDHYSGWLQRTSIPKLLMYAVPGFITTIDTVQWARDHLSNLSIVCLEDVLHFPQETAPKLFTDQLVTWYLEYCDQ